MADSPFRPSGATAGGPMSSGVDQSRLGPPAAPMFEPPTNPPPTQPTPPASQLPGTGDERGHGQTAAVPAPPQDRATSVLRVPKFSPLAPLLGWLSTWGTIAVTTAILQRVDVPVGFNLGIARGGPGDSGFWAGIWGLAVSGGGFVLGGYTAARLARAHGMRHAVLVWTLAMAATAADAINVAFGEAGDGVIRRIVGVPFWGRTGLIGDAEAFVVLALFAGVSLVGVIFGGALGQAANRIERTDAVITRPRRTRHFKKQTSTGEHT